MPDPLEQTHPPAQFRCDAHEAMMGDIRDTRERLVRVEEKVDSIGKRVDSGFNDLKEQIRDLTQHDQSLNGRVGDLQIVTAQGKGAAGLTKWALPLLITLGLGTVTAGVAVIALAVDIIMRFSG